MSGFAPSGAGTIGLDPNKRVNYQLGLVLGEDEFRQDQLHHRERDHRATRALHGYGTVSGLGLAVDEATGQIHVRPGLAVDAAGRLICVPVEYCASLGGWVQDQAADDPSGGVPPALSVYVVLCWTECTTDDVPIPADSCLSAEDSRAASRILDSFELRLSLEAPAIVGEVAPTSSDSLADLVDELHGLLDVSGGSPPDMAGVAGLLRDWAVDRRPEVIADEACLPAPADPCVLLGRVDIELEDGPSGIAVTAASVDDADRPILVSTRLLQEALFAVGSDQVVPDHQHTLSGLGDVDLGSGPTANDILRFDGTDWIAVAEAAGGTGDHGALTGLGDDDHPQYLRTDGGRALAGDLSAGGNRLTDLPPSNATGQPIVQRQAAGGDLREEYPDPRLGAIQGTPLDARTPNERDVLLHRRGEWVSGRPWILPFVTIQPMRDRNYALWFNLDAPTNDAEVKGIDAGLVVHRETDTGSFLRRVGPESVNQIIRNVFLVAVREDTTPLRFTFELENIALSSGATVREWADEFGIWFVGQSGSRGETVTSFVLTADRLG